MRNKRRLAKTDVTFSLNGTAFHVLSEVDYSIIGPKNCSFARFLTPCPATIHQIDDTATSFACGVDCHGATEPEPLTHWNVDTLNPVHAIMNTISDELLELLLCLRKYPKSSLSLQPYIQHTS
jgi:hypothetical protein